MKDHILIKYNVFLEKLPQEWESLAGLAYTPKRYFYLADVQMKDFIISLEKNFINFDKPSSIDYVEKCYSYCYGFYTLIRTCLEISGKFSDKFQEQNFSVELKSYRDSVKREIKKVVDISNDYVKHPVDNNGKITWYEPAGLDNSGEMSIYEWSTINNKHFKILTVNPIHDLNVVFNHLEKLAELYTERLNTEEQD